MNALADYRAFLEAKAITSPAAGVAVPEHMLNPNLKPHTRAIARWMLEGGRRAVFASFGLHKTSTQIEVMRQLAPHVAKPRLIVMPLGVRREFFKDGAERFSGEHAVDLRFVRREAEVDDTAPIYLTNYETIREGKIDPALFDAVSLDEASVLRSYGSKTYQEFTTAFAATRFKFVATATPSPNRTKELIHYAGFLGVMDTGQALTRFFQRNSEKAGDLTLYPHKEREFRLWCASWGAFVRRPSDLGFSDDGYALPPLTIRWHEVPVDLSGDGTDRDGQYVLMRESVRGLAEEARERRAAIPAVVERMAEIVAAAPEEHVVLWHDLEDERRAIERAIPGVVSVFGAQDLEEREARIEGFAEGRIARLSTKPIIAGSGTNIQRHCRRAVYAGVGHKFNDLIQSVHRLQRFGQTGPVEIDIVYPETMREARRDLEAKWARHDQQAARMSDIIREFGLNGLSLHEAMGRAMGVTRVETGTDRWRIVNNDCVEESKATPSNSVDLIVTSVPFSNHYEYTPSYNDFGHTDCDEHFFGQMDYLTPELLRVLKPGRLACVHVKDRILFGSVTGYGTPTVNPFHAKTLFHYMRHGFAYMGMIFIDTDVVRENNQTYRLGWTENGKDSTKMGVGSPEFVLIFRKLPTDRSKSYADDPVTKEMPLCLTADRGLVPFDRHLPPAPGTGYSRARWQIDAHARWRSSGDRLIAPDEMAMLSPDAIAEVFRAFSVESVYDYETHVRIGEDLAARFSLPATFLSLWPGSHRDDVWTDIARMRTLNTEQAAKGREKHVCPLQFDIVDRLIGRYSLPGELILDPFAGIGTVPLRAVKAGRRGTGFELHAGYCADAIRYLQALDRGMAMPTLFDFLAAETLADRASMAAE